MAALMQKNQALLLLGSNIEPELNLPAAIRELSVYGDIKSVSAVWESPPYGFLEQANFLNAAVRLVTELSLVELKEIAITDCENRLDRVRSANKNAPRTIDIDIIYFNSDIVHTGKHRIPDPDALLRPFIAIPLAEIAPDYLHPETGEPLRLIANRFLPELIGMVRRDDVILT